MDCTANSSKELLRAEALMDKVPAILNLKAKTKPPFSKGSTFKPPPSSVLQRARNFLPVMAQANAEVEKQLSSLPPGALDIEAVEDAEGPIIEMNIALVERGACSEDSDSSLDSSDEDEVQEDSSDCNAYSSESTNTGNGPLGDITENSLKLPGGRVCGGKKPGIQILNSDSCIASDNSLGVGEQDLQLSETVTSDLENRTDLDLHQVT